MTLMRYIESEARGNALKRNILRLGYYVSDPV